MLSKLTYKQKLQLLIAGFVLLLIFCYQLAISKTITEYKMYEANKKHSGLSKDSSVPYSVLQQKIKLLNDIQTQYSLDTTEGDRNFLLLLDGYCKDYNLVFKEYKPFKDEKKVWTRSVTIEGNFIDILNLIYELEQNEKTTRVCSVNFKTSKANAKGKLVLSCTFYIQNLLK